MAIYLGCWLALCFIGIFMICMHTWAFNFWTKIRNFVGLSIVALFCVMLISCASTVFGGQIVGRYYNHFNNQLQCAMVKGWFDETKCMCWITQKNFSKDRSFLSAPEVFCGGEEIK